MKRGPMVLAALATAATVLVLVGVSRRAPESRPSAALPGPDGGSWVATAELRIAFPEAPAPPEHAVQGASWGRVDVTTWRLRRPSGVSYQLQRMEADAPLNEQGDVDGALKALASQAHEAPALLGDQRVAIGECAGRDFSARVTGLTLRSLLCVRGTHAYMAQAAVPASVSSEAVAEADAFLQSFVIAK